LENNRALPSGNLLLNILKALVVALNIGAVGFCILRKERFLLIYATLFLLFFLFAFHKSAYEREFSFFGSRALLSSRIVLFFFLLAVCRLIHIQFKNSLTYSGIIKRQSDARYDQKGVRGEIFDIGGKNLAYNIANYDLAMDPSLAWGNETVEKALREIFDLEFISVDREEFLASLESLARNNRKYKLIARSLDEKQREAVSRILKEHNLGKNQIYFRETGERVYYKKDLYQSVIGYLGYADDLSPDKTGRFGVERTYDAYLQGKSIRREFQVDENRRKIPSMAPEMQKQINGKNIYLTIDSDIQTILREEVEKQFQQTESEAAYAVAMDPRSGRILALVDLYVVKGSLRNGVLQDQVEPGSIFKSVIMSAALNEKLVRPQDKFDIGNGTLTRVDHTIRETTKTLRGVITAEEVLARSSNTGMVLVGEKFSRETFGDYLQKFGFYERTGVDFPGELQPVNLPLKNWNLLTKVNMSFGQGIVVTPIQMATAFSAVVNGGVLYRPYLVDRVEDENRVVIRRNVPRPRRRVINSDTSATMRSMLELTVQKGTGTRAKVDGFPVGGKTGTGQIASRKGGYLPDDYLASFIGFFPVDQPRYVILLMFVKPNRGKRIEEKYGGAVAAPVFAAIAKRLIKVKSILPEESPRVQEIKNIEQVAAEISGVNRAGRRRIERMKMPDLTGLSPQEVINIFFDQGIEVKIEGTGLVESQSPPPDTALYGVGEIKVRLSHEIKLDIPVENLGNILSDLAEPKKVP
jgi:cell division protein FtsI (penicillin-binding protein 3)